MGTTEVGKAIIKREGYGTPCSLRRGRSLCLVPMTLETEARPLQNESSKRPRDTRLVEFNKDCHNLNDDPRGTMLDTP
ncbi:hypothetical protein DPEC_G00198260 [Dallia pectoralis]|uniref:Uncharacterized protein n=1 Tax=Dallia pectoralis TaxID=75939 RepID=A0ACC2G870_DALPE|nr:hypothetical protein DPEC_G00198260 [Dallia pectoralis]